MRFILIVIVAVPALLAFRTLGLLHDWLALREWARTGAAARAPALHEPVLPTDAPKAAATAARRRFVASGLLTAAAACFSLAGALTLARLLGWA